MTLPLDTDAVAGWLSAHMPGFSCPVRAQQVMGGQSNPTYLLDTPGGRYVLRRKPPGKTLKSAHAVEREFRVQRALGATSVPVARMHVLCEDDSVIGSPFYVMAHVQGVNHDDPRLPDHRPEVRQAIFAEMNRVLAAIHDVDLAATGLADYGPQGGYFARQLSRWSGQYRASETETLEAMDTLMDWLARNPPEDDGQVTLVHGDYRLDNLRFDPVSAECRAVFDWELSTLGHPTADLAGVLMQWAMPAGAQGRGLAGVDRAAFGIPSDQAFLDAYCTARDIPGLPRFNRTLAFSFFRMGAILQGVKKRALDGNAADPDRAHELGAFVADCAKLGLRAAKED